VEEMQWAIVEDFQKWVKKEREKVEERIFDLRAYMADMEAFARASVGHDSENIHLAEFGSAVLRVSDSVARQAALQGAYEHGIRNEERLPVDQASLELIEEWREVVEETKMRKVA
jgi:hypothetical protein